MQSATVTERKKKKKPPTFHYLPKGRAKQLKKSWIEDRKIRSKWKAQKKRDGLTSQAGAPVEGPSGHRNDESNANSKTDKSPDRPTKSSSPRRDQRSLRDLGRIAHVSKPSCTPKSDFTHPQRVPRYSHSDRGGKAIGERETGQPNMKLRMNVLLEKIKRDFS